MRWGFLFWLNTKHNKHKTKQQKNVCIEEKVMTSISFNPGLALAGFRTILPCFQQVNLTWAAIKSKTSTWSSGQLPKNTWSQWVVDLSPRYGHMILASRYLVMTGVNCSYIKKVHGKPRLHVSINLLFGVWPPCCAAPPSSSPSCVSAHEQYRCPW